MAPVGYDWLMSVLNRIARAWSSRILLRLSEGSFMHRPGASPRPSVSAPTWSVGLLRDRSFCNTVRLWRCQLWAQPLPIAHCPLPIELVIAHWQLRIASPLEETASPTNQGG